jgi:hypothetical protein
MHRALPGHISSLFARRCRLRFLAVVAVVAMVASGIGFSPPAQADTICNAAGNTCTTTVTLPTGTPPALLDLTSNRLYRATPAEAASLQVLEDTAVADTISDHDLSTSDADAVLTWGRDDAEAELWALLVQAVQDCATTTCTTDQQNAVDWLDSVETTDQVESAQDAGQEYADWAGIPGYQSELSIDPSESALQSFLSAAPEPFVLAPSGSYYANLGYCSYQPPGGGYNPDDEMCYGPCTDLLGCSPNTPSYDQFVQWGDTDVNNQIMDNTDYMAQAMEIAVGATFGSVALGTGVAVAGAAASGALASSVPYAIAQSLFQVFYSASGAFGSLGVGPDMAAAAAEALSAELTVSGIAGAVGIIIAAVAIAVTEALNVFNAAALPGQLAQAITTTPSTPDLDSMLSNQSEAQGLYALFVGATLPVPTLSPCPSGASSCDVSGSTYPDFLVTPQSGGPGEAEQSITWLDGAGSSAYTDSATLSGNWFIEQMASASAQLTTLQTLRIHYTNWDGQGETAWLLGNPTEGYEFVGFPDSDASSGAPIDTATCQADASCWSSKTIDYVGDDGNDYSASVIAPALPTARVTESPNPTAGTPQSFSASIGPALPLYGLPYSYSWQFETTPDPSPISGVTCTGGVTCPSSTGAGSGSGGTVTYGPSVTGAQVSHTWPTNGTFSVQLTVTNSLGTSVVQTFSVTVGVNPDLPTVQVTAGADPVEDSAQSFSAATAGAGTTGLPLSYSWQFQTPPGGSPISGVTCVGGVTCPSGGGSTGAGSGSGGTATYGPPVTGPQVSHTWPTNGTFSVQLTVTNSLGTSVVQTFSVTVGVNPDLPTVQVTAGADPFEGGSQSFSAATTGTANVGLPLSYAWQFQTSPPSTTTTGVSYSSPVNGAQANHIWPTSGTFYLQLTVTNSLGQSVSETLSDTVSDVVPVISDLTPSCWGTGLTCQGLQVNANIDHTGYDDTETVTVDWGDGSVDSASVVAGTSFLSATFDLLSSSVSSPIALSDFHTYATAGTYEVTVTVVDQDGGQANQALEVAVGTTPQAIRFSGISTQRYGQSPPQAEATGDNSGEPVVISSSAPTVCSVGGVSTSDAPGASARTTALVSLLGTGTCTLTATQAGNAAYPAALGATVSFVVGPVPLRVVADDQSVTYGEAPTYSVTYQGLANGDTSSVVSGLSCGAVDSGGQPVSSSTPVGSYTITCSGADAANYTISYQTGQLRILPAQLTVTADDQTVPYGGPLPALTASYSGFVGNDSVSSLTTPALCRTSATTPSGVGLYEITCGFVRDNNYRATYELGTLTVTPAPLTITPEDETMAYGGTVPAFAVSYSGLVNGDTASAVSGLTCSAVDSSRGPVGSTTSPGTYTITCSGASAANYAISYETGTLTVESADADGEGLTSTSTTIPNGGAGLTTTATTALTTTPGEPAGTTSSTTAGTGGTTTTITPGPGGTTSSTAAGTGGTTSTTTPSSAGTTATPAPGQEDMTTTSSTSGGGSGGAKTTTSVAPNPGAASTGSWGTTGTTPSTTASGSSISSPGGGSSGSSSSSGGNGSGTGSGGGPGRGLSTAHKPQISALSPDVGAAVGGTTVIIKGKWFEHVERVSFGGRPARFEVASADELVAHSPAGAGTVAVVVKTAAGASDPRKADQYTYFLRSQVLHLAPASGSKAGGSTVVIRGKSFDQVEKVSFGAHAARFEVVSADEITARSPRGSGTVAVVVTTPGGPSGKVNPDRFSYVAKKTQK